MALPKRDNVDEATIAAQERMTTAEEAFALAKTLREQNHVSEALTIAQAGLPLTGNCRYSLASWTSELAEGVENLVVVLEASGLL